MVIDRLTPASPAVIGIVWITLDHTIARASTCPARILAKGQLGAGVGARDEVDGGWTGVFERVGDGEGAEEREEREQDCDMLAWVRY